MIRSLLACCAVITTSSLAACADPPPPASQDSVSAPPLGRAGAVDGAYNGIMRLTTGDAVVCGTLDTFTVTVSGRAFRYVLNQPQVPWQPRRTFEVTIAQDGAFRSEVGPAYMVGSISQGHMQGQLVGDSCGFVFEADSTGTF